MHFQKWWTSLGGSISTERTRYATHTHTHTHTHTRMLTKNTQTTYTFTYTQAHQPHSHTCRHILTPICTHSKLFSSFLPFFFLFLLIFYFSLRWGMTFRLVARRCYRWTPVIELGGLRNENLHIERLFNVLEIRELTFHNSLQKYVITGNKSKDLDPFAFRSPPFILEEKRAGRWEAHEGAYLSQNKASWASSARRVQGVCSCWLSNVTCNGKGHIRLC